MEIEYYQEIWKKQKRNNKDISKHCRYFQN